LKFPDSPGDIFPHNANPFDAITNLTADLPRRLLTLLLHSDRAGQRPAEL
jgi:hypothetical protein